MVALVDRLGLLKGGHTAGAEQVLDVMGGPSLGFIRAIADPPTTLMPPLTPCYARRRTRSRSRLLILSAANAVIAHTLLSSLAAR